MTTLFSEPSPTHAQVARTVCWRCSSTCSDSTLRAAISQQPMIFCVTSHSDIEHTRGSA